jgi:regulation of enolase protein 1 (concanavalin A-like superfamily)
VSQADAAGYSVVITNVAGSVTSATATLTVIDPPVITGQPASRTNDVGTTATFTVTATGTTPSYQWMKGAATLINGGNVSGATTATLTLTNVSQTDATNYSVVVSNIAGTVTSATATLTVMSLPAPWLTMDIGAVGLAGSASESAGTYTLRGSGAGITGTADQFRYVYQTMSGDGSIKARIVSHSSTLAASLAGVMIRETTNANSRFAMAAHRGSGNSNMRALRRTTTGGSVASTSSTSMTPSNCWVQVTRTGNSLAMMSSTNGTTWTTINTITVTMAANITVGLIDTSASNTAINTTVFNSVTVVP